MKLKGKYTAERSGSRWDKVYGKEEIDWEVLLLDSPLKVRMSMEEGQEEEDAQQSGHHNAALVRRVLCPSVTYPC
jgi:hypothetical protein